MRRALVALGIVGIVVVVIGMLVSADALPSWVPVIGEKQSITIRVVDARIPSAGREGEICPFSSGLHANSVTVRDASGDIVGEHSSISGSLISVPGSTAMRCAIDFAITAPRSDYYSVYIDDHLVKTVSRSDAKSGVLEVTAD